MTTAIQIKLLAGILAVLCVIAGLLIRASRPPQEELIHPDAKMEKQFEHYLDPPKKPYLIP